MPPKPKGKAAKHLGRASSEVHYINASGAVVRNFVVWTDLAPSVKDNPETVFAKCVVLPGSNDKEVKVRQLEPPEYEGQEFTVSRSRCYNANDESVDPASLRDIGLLQHQNTAAVLFFLYKRFMNNHIYTTADPLLVAVNPFRDIGVCTDDWIAKYRDVKDIRKLPPHSFGVAREALDYMYSFNKSQTIIVTGESGAGKTEATKHCMRFFAASKSSMDLRIQNAVMAANPVLESFGNAKTIRNNNSSRFGRFMQLTVAAKGGIVNGKVQGFLLEKVRVVSQQPNERSFHIFYQFLKGATAEEKKKYKLEGLKNYNNLIKNSGGCFDAPGIDDVEEMDLVRKSLVSMQLSPTEIHAIFSIVAGVLKLGNVEFVGKNIDGADDAAELEPKSMETLREACSLLFLDDFQKVADGLRTTFKQIGGEDVMMRVQKRDAYLLCASLGKAMYDTLFKWIIKRLNATIEPERFDKFMGMLDIFGFEIFEDNSLEQLLINITNEFLQKNFVDIVFERESRLYREEGVSTTELVFTDNKDVIDCLIGKRNSVFACLEDGCVAKNSTDVNFHSNMKQVLGSNKCFEVPQGGDRDLRFIIVHTIAEIEYSAQGFIGKNMDILKAELTEVAQASPNPVVQQMFEGIIVERGKLPRTQLIASQFLIQLDTMMKIIMETEPHFIRCIKPNETKKPLDWANDKVLNQLFSLSILEALQLKKLGFSWRRPFGEFVYNYRYLNMAIADEMERCQDPAKQRQLAVQMLDHMQTYFNNKDEFVEQKQWQLGKTMVFLKPDIAQNLMLIQRQAMEDWVPSVVLIEAMYKRHLMKQSMTRVLPPIVRVQALVRRQLTQAGSPLATYDPMATGGAVLIL
eukprot:Protomagalhaensia_sp_Gyna_25__5566@NODE_760_length_2680_cov_63_492238_g596_i0_p1_GENE_NODE_760_length_2680_cov_63_492238_g596_i0NODE_760_length_2680_cov_63_492238_g596_i0_p1_ORF_typecomplete_len866_score208_02Myosin_head/PF00063_21/1_9e186TniB/PF05621_11/0_0065TniB/PF05621_11/76TniB/PF05621_11/1_3e04ABC_tran/PF00005_27/0_0049AAA_22/PF13401_6/0_091AAA_22/PF13401_6/9_1e02AAA_22/PF13401_6/2_2e03AAA_16/PF13191_6/0_12RNA_helicase/PF00910_22/4_7RNA_helicase/PF00910_22/2e02T2SSE/PF00437_20/0_2AAA_19/PF